MMKHQNYLFNKISIGIFLLLTFIQFNQVKSRYITEVYEADVATAWFDLQLLLVRDTPGFSPPVASRAFGYTGVTLYESFAAGSPEYLSLTGQLNGLDSLPQLEADKEYHRGVIVNSALAEITGLLFPTAPDEHQRAIDALYDEWTEFYQHEIEDVQISDESARFGQAIANAVFDWSTSDGGHEGYLRNFPTDFVLLEGEGLWSPTPRLDGDPQPAMQPYWGSNRPFVLDSGEECMPSAPPVYSKEEDSAFYLEAAEVYETSRALTPQQQQIALFWADDPVATATPPGHSIAILTQILKREEVALEFAAVAYAKMGIAVADAFIGCWNAKYTYNLVRPVTFIQQFIDSDWMPIVNTPPFPEYPSGHSVQIGAAKAVLSDLFGDSYTFTDHTHSERGLVPRTFTSFTEMAQEAAVSRLYGGIHYRSAIELGLEQGNCIGEQINRLKFKIGS